MCCAIILLLGSNCSATCVSLCCVIAPPVSLFSTVVLIEGVRRCMPAKCTVHACRHSAVMNSGFQVHPCAMTTRILSDGSANWHCRYRVHSLRSTLATRACSSLLHDSRSCTLSFDGISASALAASWTVSFQTGSGARGSAVLHLHSWQRAKAASWDATAYSCTGQQLGGPHVRRAVSARRRSATGRRVTSRSPSGAPLYSATELRICSHAVWHHRQTQARPALTPS